MDNPTPEEIKELELSRINIRVTPVIFDRLRKIAELKGLSIEQYSAEVLQESLDGKVGLPIISAPSKLNGQESMKVTGPSFTTRRLM